MVERLRDALAADWPSTIAPPSNSDVLRTALHQSFEARFGTAALAALLRSESGEEEEETVDTPYYYVECPDHAGRDEDLFGETHNRIYIDFATAEGWATSLKGASFHVAATYETPEWAEWMVTPEGRVERLPPLN